MKNKYIILRFLVNNRLDVGAWDNQDEPLTWDTYNQAFNDIQDDDELVGKVLDVTDKVLTVRVYEHELEDPNEVTEYTENIYNWNQRSEQ